MHFFSSSSSIFFSSRCAPAGSLFSLPRELGEVLRASVLGLEGLASGMDGEDGGAIAGGGAGLGSDGGAGSELEGGGDREIISVGEAGLEAHGGNMLKTRFEAKGGGDIGIVVVGGTRLGGDGRDILRSCVSKWFEPKGGGDRGINGGGGERPGADKMDVLREIGRKRFGEVGSAGFSSKGSWTVSDRRSILGKGEEVQSRSHDMVKLRSSGNGIFR